MAAEEAAARMRADPFVGVNDLEKAWEAGFVAAGNRNLQKAVVAITQTGLSWKTAAKAFAEAYL